MINGTGLLDVNVNSIASTSQTGHDLGASVNTMVAGIIEGTAQTGTLSTTQASSDLTGYADDELIGRVITFTGGTADGQSATITDYASTNGLVTFEQITTAPANNDTFKIT